MNKTDIIYQNAVDEQANKLLVLPPFQFKEIEEYGSLKIPHNNSAIELVWNHWKLDNDLHHVVFITSRRIFFFLHKKYINGAKLKDGKIELLTNNEIGMYD